MLSEFAKIDNLCEMHKKKTKKDIKKGKGETRTVSPYLFSEMIDSHSLTRY